MKLKTREYQRGDEHDINKLYKRVANIDRNQSEYDWEWFHTWDGPGFVRLMFDEDRAEGDQLVAQYSLIPTPFSVWGKPYLAGKTENCMCHPDYRGKGIYFPHEKNSFEEARQKFQLFFTTAGNATKGAPGAVRRKLGYIAFDSWVQFVYVTNRAYLGKTVQDWLKKYLPPDSSFLKISSSAVSRFVYAYFALHSNRVVRHDIRWYGKEDAPLADIERLWTRNKASYGVSIDRLPAYLEWRVNNNPYYEHFYLCAYESGNLAGYIIFFWAKNKVIRILDILADSKDERIFADLLRSLTSYAREQKADAVKCTTTRGNRLLRKVFRRNGFLPDISEYKKVFEHRKIHPFNVFISEEIQSQDRIFKPSNWYITDLIKEGRVR